VLLSTPHTAIWCVDTEYQHRDGERDQRPICLVAREFYSGRVIRLWEDELRRMTQPPFDIDERSIIVVYGAFAELNTFKVLGWPKPRRILDLYPEFRCQDNDAHDKSGSLLAALTKFDLPHMSVEDKEACRRLILDQNSWDLAERRRIIRYCEADVDALTALLPVLVPGIESLDEAFLRSDYMVAITEIGRNGIPMDVPSLRFMQRNWDNIRGHIAAEAHAVYGTFPGGEWDRKAAEQYLEKNRMLDIWPISEKSGMLSFDKDVLRDMCRLYPSLNLLREAKSSVGKVRPVDLDIGSDGRCRSPLYPFGTVTGRNAPRRFPFAPATWTRSLICPFYRRAIAYCDYSGQELGLGAAYSDDRNMKGAYLSGDFYLTTARQFGIAPPDATKRHPAREVAKTLCLGLNYGMTVIGLADRLNIGYAEAADLLARHRAAYPRFWEFADAMVDTAMFRGRLISAFGWQFIIPENLDPNGRVTTNSRALRNFVFQAGGGDMLRIAAIGLRAAGITVIATVHDAVMIEADEADIDEHVAVTKAVMVAASEVVTGGLPLRVDHRIFRSGERYFDPRGVAMWNRIVRWSRKPNAVL
jgi:DNA polymerase family A